MYDLYFSWGYKYFLASFYGHNRNDPTVQFEQLFYVWQFLLKRNQNDFSRLYLIVQNRIFHFQVEQKDKVQNLYSVWRSWYSEHSWRLKSK